MLESVWIQTRGGRQLPRDVWLFLMTVNNKTKTHEATVQDVTEAQMNPNTATNKGPRLKFGHCSLLLFRK